jgi:hypothetical protein
VKIQIPSRQVTRPPLHLEHQQPERAEDEEVDLTTPLVLVLREVE